MTGRGAGLTKRQFLARAGAATAAVCAWEPVLAMAGTSSSSSWRCSLNGEWRVARAGTNEWLPATVPGNIHTDLLAAGKIPEPFYRQNERAVQWVGESGWIYRRTFSVPREALEREVLQLRCDGLDTLATVSVNGHELGRANNMFRAWVFDAKPVLKPGENVIEVSFDSPLPYMKAQQAGRSLFEWRGVHEPEGRAWVRKEPCNFGWDWGPVLITCGIWKDIGIEGCDDGGLADILILQDHSQSGRVRLETVVTAWSLGERRLNARVAVRHQRRTIASGQVGLRQGKGSIFLDVLRPKLWWPAGLGEQALYEVEVELVNEQGRVLERASRRIGLRTLKLVEAGPDRSLHFEVNGVAFFAKGANWIPSDTFTSRVGPRTLRRYVADAVAANMNTLRFWGGGYYEEDELFDACDEMGICVWLDFKFACSSYPAFDDAFLENVRLEARDQLRRLRHHPCIAVWCGNNEISLLTKDAWSESSMGRGDYNKLFKEVLGGQVRECAPQSSFVSGSPECGDVHYWGVWHGGEPFEDYRTLTGFLSEFGFQSYPEPRTVRSYTAEADRDSVASPVMEWHERSADGTQKMRDLALRYFKPPRDFESGLWLSQIVQGYGIKLGAEYWRQTMPRSMGCLFWQYNDCWPGASWSSVDWYGRWKALHYLARRFYAPVLVSAREDASKGTVEVYVTSDNLEPCRGTLRWELTDLGGRKLTGGSMTIDIPPLKSEAVTTLDLGEHLKTHGINNVVAWLGLAVGRQIVSENVVTFTLPKQLELADPRLKTTVALTGNGFGVTLTCERPALWCWLSLDDLDADYSDNFVHLRPGVPARITVRPRRSVRKTEFVKALRVRSLFDTCVQP